MLCFAVVYPDLHAVLPRNRMVTYRSWQIAWHSLGLEVRADREGGREGVLDAKPRYSTILYCIVLYVGS